MQMFSCFMSCICILGSLTSGYDESESCFVSCACAVCPLPFPSPRIMTLMLDVDWGGGLFELECHQFLDSFSSFKRIGMLAQKQ